MKAKLIPIIFFSLVTMVIAETHTVDQKEQLFSAEGRPQISVKNQDGETRIFAGSSAEVKVRYKKEVRNASSRAEAEKEARRVDVQVAQKGNEIRVQVYYPKSYFQILPRPRVLVHIEIETPRASDITVESSDGPVYVKGIDGNIVVASSDGNVAVHDCSGTIDIKSSDGNLDIQRASGNAKLRVSDGDVGIAASSGTMTVRSSDGDIQVTDFGGDLDIETSDGNVMLNGKFGALRAEATDGNLTIAAQRGSTPQADWALKTSDGDVELSLPDDFSADIEVSTSDGKIISQTPVVISGSLSSNKLKGKISGGGPLLSIRTADGDVVIKGL